MRILALLRTLLTLLYAGGDLQSKSRVCFKAARKAEDVQGETEECFRNAAKVQVKNEERAA